MFSRKYVCRIAERTNDVLMETKEQRISLAIPRVDLVAIPAPSIDTPLSKVKKITLNKIKANFIRYNHRLLCADCRFRLYV